MELRSQKNRVYSFFYLIATSQIFKSISFTIIIANTIVLGMTKDKETKYYNSVLEILNLFFFGFFVFELITKMAGQGIKLYF
jgi:Ion transport protein